MAKQTNTDAKLTRYAIELLTRLGYTTEQLELNPGVLREAREVIGRVHNNGHAAGYSDGHKHGWEDRGRDPSETNLPRKPYQLWESK